MVTTYNIKSRVDGFVWQFNYYLNGHLKAFEILSGKLSEKQKTWLKVNFPFDESVIKEEWMKKLRKNFEITVGEPDLSFEAFWDAYDNKKGKKKMAENTWNKMSKAKRIKAMLYLKRYNDQLRIDNVAKAYPSTYLNQEYYENN